MKKCYVPLCKSNSISHPNKLFFNLPVETYRRQQWCELAKESVPVQRDIFFCEDHFDKEKYVKQTKTRLILSKLSIPTKFACQGLLEDSTTLIKQEPADGSNDFYNKSLRILNQVKCSVMGCNSVQENNSMIQFYNFPLRSSQDLANLQDKWIQATNVLSSNSNTYVCSLHFSQFDFEIKNVHGRRVWCLEPNAVPTLLLPKPHGEFINVTIKEEPNDESYNEDLNQMNVYNDSLFTNRAKTEIESIQLNLPLDESVQSGNQSQHLTCHACNVQFETRLLLHQHIEKFSILNLSKKSHFDECRKCRMFFGARKMENTELVQNWQVFFIDFENYKHITAPANCPHCNVQFNTAAYLICTHLNSHSPEKRSKADDRTLTLSISDKLNFSYLNTTEPTWQKLPQNSLVRTSCRLKNKNYSWRQKGEIINKKHSKAPSNCSAHRDTTKSDNLYLKIHDVKNSRLVRKSCKKRVSLHLSAQESNDTYKQDRPICFKITDDIFDALAQSIEPCLIHSFYYPLE